MRRYFLLFIISLSYAFAAIAQPEPVRLNELTERYAAAKDDISKTQALLSLDSFYLYYRDDSKVILDSAVLMAKQASDLSLQANFKQGYIDAQFLLANAYAEKQDIKSAMNLINKTTDTPKIHMLIMMAERYVFRPGELKQNLDSAYLYIQQAIKLSADLQSDTWSHFSKAILAKYYFANGDIENGKQALLRIIQYYQQQNNKAEEAKWWAEAGRLIPHTDSTYRFSEYSFEKAYILYGQLNDKSNLASVAEDLAYVYMSYGELQKAQAKYIEALNIKKSAGISKRFNQYYNLSKINLQLGNYNTALYYALAAKSDLKTINDLSMAGIIYAQLGDAYNALGEKDKSLQWYRSALSNLVDYKTEYQFPIVSQIANLLLQKNQAEEALNFLSAYVKTYAPVRLIDKEIVAGAYADCYNALKQFNRAEKYYLQMIALDNAVQSHLKNTTQAQRGNTITGAQAYYNTGKFYVERKQFDIAKMYLDTAMRFKQFAPSISLLSDIYFMLFKVDSANGHYLSAINNFEFYKALNDSIFNDTKGKQIAEMQAKYEANKKEKDIENLKLKESNQSKELQKTIQARNYTYMILIVLILFMTGIYRMYRLKQIKNKQLETHQQEINEKNTALESLINDKDKLLKDKDGLLEEKEWLLKEIHHRVKNNLQIVISLLSTQSKYLDNEEAIAAISESRHRMQAMSLIHQKLYQSENTTSVNMQSYITELADYLKTSFNSGKEIKFLINVDAIELDLSQAIPVSLILNEVITNAIKYAFEERDAANIYINMHNIQDNKISLEVKDNGKGIPADFDIKNASSMGMRLVIGLVKQISGELNIANESGTCFKITFDATSTIAILNNGKTIL